MVFFMDPTTDESGQSHNQQWWAEPEAGANFRGDRPMAKIARLLPLLSLKIPHFAVSAVNCCELFPALEPQ
jgi:hypothetical protein